MVRYFCDICGKEKDQLISCNIPCHLWSFRGKAGYVDNDLQPMSGRYDSLGLCRQCHNIAYSSMVDTLLKILDNTKQTEID